MDAATKCIPLAGRRGLYCASVCFAVINSVESMSLMGRKRPTILWQRSAMTSHSPLALTEVPTSQSGLSLFVSLRPGREDHSDYFLRVEPGTLVAKPTKRLGVEPRLDDGKCFFVAAH